MKDKDRSIGVSIKHEMGNSMYVVLGPTTYLLPMRMPLFLHVFIIVRRGQPSTLGIAVYEVSDFLIRNSQIYES